jgi:hypothetical protein
VVGKRGRAVHLCSTARSGEDEGLETTLGISTNARAQIARKETAAMLNVAGHIIWTGRTCWVRKNSAPLKVLPWAEGLTNTHPGTDEEPLSRSEETHSPKSLRVRMRAERFLPP